MRSARTHRRRPRRGFTLIEMLTTVAVLIIVLGLMVSLARNVRDQSAQHLTRELLVKVAQMVDEYQQRNARQLPQVTAIIPPDAFAPPDEHALALLARRNNEQIVRALRHDLNRAGRPGAAAAPPAAQGEGRPGGPDRPADDEPSVFGQLPLSVYDGITLRDAWGSPIVFMPAQHRWIGMAPRARGEAAYFFFSAGPDRKYLTRDDNLYSYEVSAGAGETP